MVIKITAGRIDCFAMETPFFWIERQEDFFAPEV
jgi:hypothetical protein